jgi:DNA-binding NtrC family response regulator
VPEVLPDRPATVLVVDDEGIVQEVLATLLSRRGFEVATSGSAEEALEALAVQAYDVVLLDLMLPGADGLSALRTIRERYPDQSVIMMTAFASVESAVEAMKNGAFHYITKPFKNDEVLLLVDKAIETRRLRDENRRLRRALLERNRFEQIVGKSRVMHDVFRLVEQVAPSRSTVLVQGESGTGKELIAHALHARSGRAPFIVVQQQLVDLLEKPSSDTSRASRVRPRTKGPLSADGGLVFLDEIKPPQVRRSSCG